MPMATTSIAHEAVYEPGKYASGSPAPKVGINNKAGRFRNTSKLHMDVKIFVTGRRPGLTRPALRRRILMEVPHTGDSPPTANCPKIRKTRPPA